MAESPTSADTAQAASPVAELTTVPVVTSESPDNQSQADPTSEGEQVSPHDEAPSAAAVADEASTTTTDAMSTHLPTTQGNALLQPPPTLEDPHSPYLKGSSREDIVPGHRAAYFSTRLGTTKPRAKDPMMPVIARSGAQAENVHKAAWAWITKYKWQCMCIFPEQGWELDDLWDEFDQDCDGVNFLTEVLNYIIMLTNVEAINFGRAWLKAHPEHVDTLQEVVANEDPNEPFAIVDKVFLWTEPMGFPRTFLYHVAHIMLITISLDNGLKCRTLDQVPQNTAAPGYVVGQSFGRDTMGGETSDVNGAHSAAQNLSTTLHPTAPAASEVSSSVVTPSIAHTTTEQTFDPHNLHPRPFIKGKGKLRDTNSIAHLQSEVSGSSTRQTSGPMHYSNMHPPMPMAQPVVMPPYYQGQQFWGPSGPPGPPGPHFIPANAMAQQGMMMPGQPMMPHANVGSVYMSQPHFAPPHGHAFSERTNQLSHRGHPSSPHYSTPHGHGSRGFGSRSSSGRLWDPYPGTNATFNDGQVSNSQAHNQRMPSASRPRGPSMKKDRSTSFPNIASQFTGSTNDVLSPRTSASGSWSYIPDPKIIGDLKAGCNEGWIGPENKTVTELFVRGLPQEVSDDTLQAEMSKLFQDQANVVPVNMFIRHAHPPEKRYALVRFTNTDDARKALGLRSRHLFIKNATRPLYISVSKQNFSCKGPQVHRALSKSCASDEQGDKGKGRAFSVGQESVTIVTNPANDKDVTYSPQDARSDLRKQFPLEVKPNRSLSTGSLNIDKAKIVSDSSSEAILATSTIPDVSEKGEKSVKAENVKPTSKIATPSKAEKPKTSVKSDKSKGKGKAATKAEKSKALSESAATEVTPASDAAVSSTKTSLNASVSPQEESGPTNKWLKLSPPRNQSTQSLAAKRTDSLIERDVTEQKEKVVPSTKWERLTPHPDTSKLAPSVTEPGVNDITGSQSSSPGKADDPSKITHYFSPTKSKRAKAATQANEGFTSHTGKDTGQVTNDVTQSEEIIFSGPKEGQSAAHSLVPPTKSTAPEDATENDSSFHSAQESPGVSVPLQPHSGPSSGKEAALNEGDAQEEKAPLTKDESSTVSLPISDAKQTDSLVPLAAVPAVQALKKPGADRVESLSPFAKPNKAQQRKEREAKKKQQKAESKSAKKAPAFKPADLAHKSIVDSTKDETEMTLTDSLNTLNQDDMNKPAAPKNAKNKRKGKAKACLDREDNDAKKGAIQDQANGLQASSNSLAKQAPIPAGAQNAQSSELSGAHEDLCGSDSHAPSSTMVGPTPVQDPVMVLPKSSHGGSSSVDNLASVQDTPRPCDASVTVVDSSPLPLSHTQDLLVTSGESAACTPTSTKVVFTPTTSSEADVAVVPIIESNPVEPSPIASGTVENSVALSQEEAPEDTPAKKKRKKKSSKKRASKALELGDLDPDRVPGDYDPGVTDQTHLQAIRQDSNDPPPYFTNAASRMGASVTDPGDFLYRHIQGYLAEHPEARDQLCSELEHERNMP